jgi:hypothetical protein
MAGQATRLANSVVHTRAPAKQHLYDTFVHKIARYEVRPVSVWKLLQTGKEASRNPRHLLVLRVFFAGAFLQWI